MEFLDINHAEAALGRPPDVTCCGIDQLVESVVAKVEMSVARCVLVEPIASGDMGIGITEIHVRRAHVRRRDGEAQERALARGNSAFLDAAKAFRKILYAYDPVLQKPLLVNDEIGPPGDHPGTGRLN